MARPRSSSSSSSRSNLRSRSRSPLVRRRKGEVIGLVREKGDLNPFNWALRVQTSCLDNPKTAALPDPPWKKSTGKGSGKGKANKGGKGKKKKNKKKRGASCAIM